MEHGQLDWRPTPGPPTFFKKGKLILNLITIPSAQEGDLSKWPGEQNRKFPAPYSHHFKWETSASFSWEPLRAWDTLAVQFSWPLCWLWEASSNWGGEDNRTPPPPLIPRVYVWGANSSCFSHILPVLWGNHWLPLVLDYLFRHVCTRVLWTCEEFGGKEVVSLSRAYFPLKRIWFPWTQVSFPVT